MPQSKPSEKGGLAAYVNSVVVATKKKLTRQKRDPRDCATAEDEIWSDVTEWISTGFPEVDYILGGGWPVGRSTEVFGPEGAGKSALMHASIRQVQRMPGLAEIYDWENALTKAVIKQQNIKPQTLVYNQPPTIEQGLDILRDHLDNYIAKPPGCPVFIAWDSIAASPPRAEVEEDSAEDSHVADQARAIGRVFRSITLKLPRARAHMVFVNQERDAIGKGPSFFKPIHTPGGRAAKYFTSLRLRCTKVATIKRGDEAVGYRIRTTTLKSRLVPPHRKADWVIDFKYGPSPELTTFYNLLDGRRIVSAGGGKYDSDLTDKPFTPDDWVQMLRENGALRKNAHAASVEIVKAQNSGGVVSDEQGDE